MVNYCYYYLLYGGNEMKKFLVSMVLAASFLFCTGFKSYEVNTAVEAGSVAEAIQNHPEVAAVLNNYMKGTYEADVDLLKNAFHPQAIMTGYMGDQLMIGDPNPFFEDIGSNPSMASQGMEYKGEITSLRVNGNIADAVIYETGFYGDGTLENHFHLLKDANGDWKIISKCFTTVN